MADKRVISMTSIAAFFRDDVNQLLRGENSYSSGNVLRVLYDSEVQPALLKGEVKSSMKNRSYSIEMSLDVDDGIVAASCSCPRGQVICHHMAAVCIFGHHNVSITDKACTWSAPKKLAEEENLWSIDDMFPSKENFCAVERWNTEAEKKIFLNRLEEPVGFCWMLKPEPTNEVLNLIPSIEDLVFSKDFNELNDKDSYFTMKARVTSEVIMKVAETTRGQHRNEDWLVCRKHRLTASHFGAVLGACSRNKYPNSLFKSLFGGYNLDHAKAVQWGRDNEKEALEMFKQGMGMEVISTGLWLDECGYLGASPDGLIGDDAVLEIKCPYKYRESDLEEALTHNKDYIIFKRDDGVTEVNKVHPYWHQIQGQLFITKRKTCYLMVWTPHKMEVVAIDKCEDWCKNIEILKNFYIQRYLPQIINKDLF